MTIGERHDFYCPDVGLGCNANNPTVRAGCSMFVALTQAANDMKEQCAKVVEKWNSSHDEEDSVSRAARQMAEEIRAVEP